LKDHPFVGGSVARALNSVFATSRVDVVWPFVSWEKDRKIVSFRNSDFAVIVSAGSLDNKATSLFAVDLRKPRNDDSRIDRVIWLIKLPTMLPIKERKSS
jgi:hypothetical protein